MDNAQIYIDCRPSELVDALRMINYDAQLVADWANDNLLELNASKTKVIILCSHKYISDLDLTPTDRCEWFSLRIYLGCEKPWGHFIPYAGLSKPR